TTPYSHSASGRTPGAQGRPYLSPRNIARWAREGAKMMVRIRQWIYTFSNPQPVSSSQFGERMNIARIRAIEEGEIAVSETKEVERKIDSLYDRVVIDRPMR